MLVRAFPWKLGTSDATRMLVKRREELLGAFRPALGLCRVKVKSRRRATPSPGAHKTRAGVLAGKAVSNERQTQPAIRGLTCGIPTFTGN